MMLLVDQSMLMAVHPHCWNSIEFKGPVSPIRHCGRLLLFSNDEMISDWLFAYRGFPLFLVDSKLVSLSLQLFG